MKKILTLTLAALMLLTSLASCRMPEKQDPFKEILEENPDMELPKSEVMEVDPDTVPKYEIEDTLQNYDEESTIELPASGDYAAGELVVKYKIYDYNKENVAIVSVENHSEQPLTIRLKGHCEDTLEEKTKTISRTFYGFAAGWQNYFVFPAQMEFDEFWYELEFEPYEGETYGQYMTNLEWQEIGLTHWKHEKDGRVMMIMMWMYDWIAKEEAKYAAHYVLLNGDGEIVFMDAEEAVNLAQKDLDGLGPNTPDSGWKRSPLHYMLEVDHNANFHDLGMTYDNSFGSCCSTYPTSDAYESSGYELPEKYQGAFGIVCFTGVWGEDTPTSEQPPDRSLYISY